MKVINSIVRMNFSIVCIVIVVALVQPVTVNAQLSDLPVTSHAHTNDHQTIVAEDTKKNEDVANFKFVDKHLFQKLFVKRRKEHLQAVKNLKNIDSYERQYKMINLLAEKMFDVIESKKALLENFSELELKNISLSTLTNNNNIKDAISSVLENIALFGDVVLNLPEITQRILKTQPNWNTTIRWSFEFLNRTRDLLDKPTLEMINLALQELNITKREPDYFNPNRFSNTKLSSQSKYTKKSSSKKEKQKRGPILIKTEL